jgi:acetyl esterase/lipase
VRFSDAGGYLRTGDEDPRADVIVGRGIEGYYWAIRHLVSRGSWPVTTYRYGDHEDGIGDLRLPCGDAPHPVVVTIHGGGWKQRWQRDLMAPLAVDLARRGFATWNVEFRRVGGSGGWPTTFEDVDAAIAFLNTVASGLELDLERACFLGHSSGGHLALLAAARGQTGIRPSLVVSIAGIPDLVEAARRELIGGENIAARLLGGAPSEVPDRYAKASPSELLPLGYKQLLVQGLADYIPDLIDLNRGYARAAQSAGDAVRLLELPSVEHLEPIEPTTQAWRQIAGEIEKAL